MHRDYRKKLSVLERLIAQAESLTAGPWDDDILLWVSKQVAELRSVLARSSGR
jgi:hypothetical protein